MKLDLLPAKLRALLEEREAPIGAPVEGPCWIYVGRRFSSNGYGRVWWLGRELQIHRVIYEIFVMGPIARGMVLDHRCKVRSCANPRHMREATVRQNTIENSVAVLFKRPAEYDRITPAQEPCGASESSNPEDDMR